MHPSKRTAILRSSTIIALAMFASLGVAAGEAAASCFARPATKPLKRPTVQIAPAPAFTLAQGDSQSSGPIVGLWRSVFTATSPFDGVYDEAFQQFHDDGTELMLSRGVPPDLGNVCLGVWRREAGGVIKLLHTSWNWSGQTDSNPFSNMPVGTFLLEVTLRANSQGTRFSGTWKATSYDDDGVLLPDLSAEGTVASERIAAD